MTEHAAQSSLKIIFVIIICRALAPKFLYFTALKPEPAVYFATLGGGIKAYSTMDSKGSTVVSSTEGCEGVTFDSVRIKIYWSTWKGGKIYRANVDGSEVEQYFSSRQ